MTKLSILFTIISVLILTGCYYQVQMAPDDYDFNSNDDIQFSTKDTIYTLKGNDYYFNNDTIIVRVSKYSDMQTRLKYNIVVPVKDIEQLEVKKIDAGDTIIILGVVALVTLGVAFFVSLSNMNW